MPRRVFISHASANAELALRICNGLESNGVPCWIAPRDVLFDGTYGTEIVKGLRECEVFLIVLTDAAGESQQVEREAERAAHYKKRIIPVLVGQSEPGPRLEFYVAGRQRFPCPSVPDERFLISLAEAIRREPSVQAAPPPPQPSPQPPPQPTPQPSLHRRLMLLAILVAIAGAIGAGYFIARRSASQPVTQVDSRPPSEVTPPPGAATAQPDTAPPPRPAGRTSSPASPAVVTETAAPTLPARDPAASPTPPAPRAAAGGAVAAVVNGVGLRFVPVPGGEFRMGCSMGDNDCDDDERPVRRVSVDPFQMSASEVTQELWEAVVGSNPSDFTGTTLPVEHVSWQDSQEFVEKLNERRDGFTYRLPTEPEWEYAARAADSAPPDLTAVAWFGLAASSARSSRPQRVATKTPNRWGLYDMLGNVAEWCEDWYSPNYQRVVRGGSWVDSARSLRVSARGKAVPTTRDYSIGLRLVRQRQ